MADELIDILDAKGRSTGEVKLKSEAHQLGLYHASVHIWFYTLGGFILFQKRANIKDTYPGLWDISVAGHIGAGESPIDSAVREIEEEIGLIVTKDDLDFVTIYLAEKKPKPDIFDNEFHHVYISELPSSVESLKLQKEEVDDVALFKIETIKKILENKAYNQQFVPHDSIYYQIIYKEITNRLL